MPPRKNYKLHLKNKKLFVEAAICLLSEEDPSNISIRKIADKAGFHNSTIYLHFRDADWLLALASVHYFRDYIKDLAELSRRNSSPYDNFFDIWNVYCRNAFEKPVLYYNFFFGKHKNDLRELFEEYFELMPEEKKDYSSDINKMFFSSNLSDRSLSILSPLADMPDTRVTQENLNMINFLILESFHGFLESLLAEDPLYEEATPSAYLELLHYLVDAG